METRTIGKKGDVSRYILYTIVLLIMLIVIIALFFGGAGILFKGLFIKDFLK